jgi:hypothetical protein
MAKKFEPPNLFWLTYRHSDEADGAIRATADDH